MSEIRYKITSANDRDGNEKKLSDDVKTSTFFLYSINIGGSAVLVYEDGSHVLKTSTVENINIWEQGVILTTLNTVYYLEPITIYL